MSHSVPEVGRGQGVAGASAAQRVEEERKLAEKQSSVFAKVIKELMEMMRKYLGSIGLNDAGLKAAQKIYQLLQGISTNFQILTAAKAWDGKGKIPSNLVTAAKNLRKDLLTLKRYPSLIKQIGLDAHPPLTGSQIKTLTKAMGSFVSKFFTEAEMLPDDLGVWLHDLYSGKWSTITVKDIVINLTGRLKTISKDPKELKEWNAAIAAMAQELSFITDQSQIRTSEISFLMQQFQTLGQGANQVTNKQFKVLELMISLTSK